MPHRLIPKVMSQIIESLFPDIIARDTADRAHCVQIKELRIGSNPTGSEQDTGWDLPDNSIIRDCWLYTDTAEATGATKTIDVGILSSEAGGDADGLLDGVSVSATGNKRGVYTTAATTYGALLRVDNDGGSHYSPALHIGDNTAKSISFTSGSAFSEFRGSIFIMYTTLYQ